MKAMVRPRRTSDYIPKKELHCQWHRQFSAGANEIETTCRSEREYAIVQQFVDDTAFNVQAYHPRRQSYTITRMGGHPLKHPPREGAAPCEGCSQAHRCDLLSLACGEFLAFVTSSPGGSKAKAAWSSPNRTMYRTIYDPPDKLELF